MMSKITYDDLKEKVLSFCILNMDSDKLDFLKNIFKNDINSVRRLSYIKTLVQLVKHLEKVDVLNCDNVQPLKTISEITGAGDALILLKLYENPPVVGNNHNHEEIRNVYQQNILHHNPQHCGQYNWPVLCPHQAAFAKKKQDCFKLLSEQLGEMWPRLARKLNDLVKEGDIDTLKRKNTTTPTKILEMFEIMESSPLYKEEELRTLLTDALNSIGRRDLKKNICIIFDRTT